MGKILMVEKKTNYDPVSLKEQTRYVEQLETSTSFSLKNMNCKILKHYQSPTAEPSHQLLSLFFQPD